MKRLLYSDETGVYRMFDYDHNHSQLLLRKSKSNENLKNVDIIFKAVYSLNVEIMYKGLYVYSIERKIEHTVSNAAERNFIYMLCDSSNLATYVDAGAFGVFENDLSYSESSLGEFTWTKNNILKKWITENSIENDL